MHRLSWGRRQIAASALCVAIAMTLVSAAPETRVLVVSIDGLMAATLDAGSRARIPILRHLAAEGAYADGVIGVLPSVTYPGHTTLITGVAPAVHGIVDNHLFDPNGTSGEAYYWYAHDIHVPTLVDAVAARGWKTAAIAWPVTVGMDVDYHVPEFWRGAGGGPSQDGLSFLRAVSTPHLIERAEAAVGRAFGWPQSDEDRRDLASFVLSAYRPRLTLVHFTELDTAQHTFGPGSPESLDALAHIDRYVGDLTEALHASEASPAYVVVVSDHGFLPVSRQLNPNATFRREGLLTTDPRGRIVSWRAVFHSSGGSGFVYLRDARDIDARRRVAHALERMRADPSGGIETVWNAHEIAQLGGPPNAVFGVNMRAGFCTGNETGAVMTRTFDPDDPTSGMRGGHGHAPQRRELQSAFIIVGPSMRGAGSLGVVRMTQIAPTIASWLGVELSPMADTPVARPRVERAIAH